MGALASHKYTDVSEAAAAEGGGNPLLSASLEYGGRAAATRPENSSGDEEEEEQNLGLRKKLRLSREQSAFLEESFKEHHSLYPVRISLVSLKLF